MIKSPCKNCNDRFIGCHGSCCKYLEFKSISNYEKSIIHKKKREEYIFYYK